MTSLSIDSTIPLRSGRKVPVLGFGVYQSTAAGKSVTAALKAGYRHVDSARMYRNEREVVKAVAAHRAAGGAPVFLTTKVASEEHGIGETELAVTESAGVAKLVGDLKWDLFLVHDPTSGKAGRMEAYSALLDRHKKGDIGSVGVSNFSEKHLEQIEALGLPLPEVNQVELHPWCQQKSIVDYCKERNIVIEAYAPLVRGQRKDDPTLVAIAEETGKNWAQVLIRWSLQRGFIPLPKSDTPERITANADVFDFELSDEQMSRLDGLDEGVKGACSWNPVNVE